MIALGSTYLPESYMEPLGFRLFQAELTARVRALCKGAQAGIQVIRDRFVPLPPGPAEIIGPFRGPSCRMHLLSR